MWLIWLHRVILARACKTLWCTGLFVCNFVDAKLSAIVTTTNEIYNSTSNTVNGLNLGEKQILV